MGWGGGRVVFKPSCHWGHHASHPGLTISARCYKFLCTKTILFAWKQYFFARKRYFFACKQYFLRANNILCTLTIFICTQTIFFACKEILFACKEYYLRAKKMFAGKAFYFIAGKQKPLTTLNHGIYKPPYLWISCQHGHFVPIWRCKKIIDVFENKQGVISRIGWCQVLPAIIASYRYVYTCKSCDSAHLKYEYMYSSQ